MARIKKVNNYKNYKLLIPTVAVGIFAVLIALSFANLKQVSIYNLVGALFRGSITVNFDCGCDSKKIFIGSTLGELCEVSAPDGYEFYSWKYGDTFIDENTVINSKEDITLVAMFKKPAEEEIWNYDYTGEMTSFVTPHDGVYTLEVWGAQGGDVELYTHGGYGGYAKGDYLLTTGDQLFIGVGGAANVKTAGYNGGGSAYDYGNYGVRAGGGGTHIGFNNDVIANTSKSDLIIVAGGGGGSYYSSGDGADGGNGGGYVGGYAVWNSDLFMYGGTQTAGGYGMRGSDGTYGMGARGQSSTGSAGGGGLYGGSGNYTAGAGGSGYIGNDLLTNKAMYCYECETSNEISTRTISNTCVDVSPNEKCSKKGDGFARISFNHLYTLEELINDGMIWNYDYNGNDGTNGSVQDFIVPINGTYKLEVWGAQGGSKNGECTGGTGAYTSGLIELNKNDILYINVGGAGSGFSSESESAGGYNGGGAGGVSAIVEGRQGGSGGGGASHIATKTGTLSLLENSISNVITAAAGGGGCGYTGVNGGAGGGYIGNDGGYISLYPDYRGTGGTQTSAGYDYFSNEVTTSAFGIGGTRVDVYLGTPSIYGGNGGGGGLYGGGGTSRSHAGGGGGSSYIGNTSLSDAIMYCYDCQEYIDSDQPTYKTISTTGSNPERDTVNCPNGYSSNPISKCAKTGNGYARITLISTN